MRYLIFLVIVSIFIFLPGLGLVHLFDWDEINFAECAREMLVTDNFKEVQINFKSFYEKPPLFIWLQAISMAIFGVNEYAARLPNAIIGIITIVLIFNIGKKLKDDSFGFIWGLIYLGSIFPQLYFKSGIIDPLFNLFIFLSINELISFSNKKGIQNVGFSKNIMFSGLFIGLAVLTKGPVAWLILALTSMVYGIWTRFKGFLNIFQILGLGIISLIPFSLWILPDIIQGDTVFIENFIVYQIRLFSTQDAGHGGPFYYHFVVLLIGCFPASIFVFSAFNRKFSEPEGIKNYTLWMKILFFVVLILFSIVKTKIIHYSSLCWLPLTFLATYSIDWLLDEKAKNIKSYQNVLFVIIGFVLCLITSVAPFINQFKEKIFPKIKDEFAKGNLSADVDWNQFIIIVPILIFILWIVSLLFINSGRNRFLGIVLLFFSSIGFTQVLSYYYIPRIEGYSQRSAISFFESKVDEDCIIEPIGYKSYAHLFYSQKRAPSDSIELNLEEIYHNNGNITKPIYFISKINSEKDVLKDSLNEKIASENGFIFYKRNIPVIQKVPIMDSLSLNYLDSSARF